MKKTIVLAFIAAIYASLAANAQNVLKNADLNQGYINWDNNGCTPYIGGVYGYTGQYYWPETVYGGTSSTNLVAETAGGCMNQPACLIKGLTYRFSFKGQRRCEADNPDLPATLSVRAIVRGFPSFTSYVDNIYNYTNTTWNWSNETMTFSIPSNSTDNIFYVIFVSHNQTSEFGALVDDVSLTPEPALTVNGPVVATANSATNWGVDNIPGSGVTYSWSFPGATPSSSASANPTNISWATQGTKTVSCILNNGNCDMVTITQNINITAPLPVDITSFKATDKNGGVELNWITANEINNDYFVVYRSKNGVQFDEIGRVKSAGISTGSSYLFTDYLAVSGNVYYRIKQVDKNGANKLSGIIKLTGGVTDLNVSVYPTAVNSVLYYTVESPAAAKLKILITDMSGRRVINGVENFTRGTTKKSTNISNLANGIYMLTVTDENSGLKKTIRFSKN
jgi:Secretion system C-terminal sorting domain